MTMSPPAKAMPEPRGMPPRTRRESGVVPFGPHGEVSFAGSAKDDGLSWRPRGRGPNTNSVAMHLLVQDAVVLAFMAGAAVLCLHQVAVERLRALPGFLQRRSSKHLRDCIDPVMGISQAVGECVVPGVKARLIRLVGFADRLEDQRLRIAAANVQAAAGERCARVGVGVSCQESPPLIRGSRPLRETSPEG